MHIHIYIYVRDKRGCAALQKEARFGAAFEEALRRARVLRALGGLIRFLAKNDGRKRNLRMCVHIALAPGECTAFTCTHFIRVHM